MDPASLIYATAALIGAVATLISAWQGFRAKKDNGDGKNGKQVHTTTPPSGGAESNQVQESATNRLLDRLSLIPRGAFRGAVKNGR